MAPVYLAMAVAFVLNGRPVSAGPAGSSVTLLQWLRARGLTGTKEGCAEGECGACAVAMRRTDAHGRPCYESINSCLVPLAAVHDETVVTVEGVAGADGRLHPVQDAMVGAGGSQCGYCTPGFVVSLFCEYYRPGRDGFDPESISGNLCRCTGYRPIADVARGLPPPAADDPRLAELGAPLPPRARVENVRGLERFIRPTGLDDLFRCLAEAPQATLIAGGTDVMVGVTQKGDRHPILVSLAALPELRTFAVTPDAIVLGAGLTLTEIEEHLHTAPDASMPLLDQLLPLFSSRLIRNRATLGGNLMTASPIGDGPPVLLALDASVTLASAGGRRTVPLRDFFLGYRQTAARPGEIMVDVRVPRDAPAMQRFYKVSKRILDDISTVAAAFALALTPDGRVARLHVAYGGVAATPLRAAALEAAAVGQPWTRATIEALLPIAAAVGTPISDLRGTADYRRAMIGRLLEKCFADTAARDARPVEATR
jgi:xanthine dehydrogenase small subunit